MLTKRTNETHIRVGKTTRLELDDFKSDYRLDSLDATIKRLMANTHELRKLKKEG